MMTLPLGLAAMQGMYKTYWPVLMASTVLSIAPLIVIFLLAQDFFIKGEPLNTSEESQRFLFRSAL